MRSLTNICIGWVILALTTLPSTAWAQPANKAAAETTIPGGTLVILSYGILWVGLLAFIGYLGWRQTKLYDELDELERRLEETVDEPSIDE
jgi:hypothetical protein